MKLEEWIISRDTGISSKTIWAVMMNVVDKSQQNSWYYDTPHDPGDFGGCYRLLKEIPKWKDQLFRVAEVFPKWKPMILEWDNLTKLYESWIQEYARRYFNKAIFSRLCELLTKLNAEGERERLIADGWVETAGNRWMKITYN
jgi:hypothetical protein